MVVDVEVRSVVAMRDNCSDVEVEKKVLANDAVASSQ
jgi:hypothetical protein